MSEQEQKFCCKFFESCIRRNEIITKEQAFPKLIHDKEFFEKHPKYLIWVNDKNPMASGYLWFHFCSNCGFKHSTDEEIEYWNKMFNK